MGLAFGSKPIIPWGITKSVIMKIISGEMVFTISQYINVCNYPHHLVIYIVTNSLSACKITFPASSVINGSVLLAGPRHTPLQKTVCSLFFHPI